MKFSIIVPVYNIEDKIYKCLCSIENQIFSDYEVLVIIDGATDRSKAICDKFEERDSRFKVVYKENGGPNSARKFGAELANGDYIINIDGDDYIDKNYLLECAKIIENYSPDMIAFGYREISSKVSERKNQTSDGFYVGKELLQIKDSVIYDTQNKGFQGGSLINTVWTKAVKRTLYQKCQNLVPNYITIGEDLILNAYLLSKIRSLYVSNISFYNYVIYDQSIMHKYNIENFKHYLDVCEELKKIDYIKDNDINVYLFQGFISEIRKVAKWSSNYLVFKETIDECKEVSKVLTLAKQAKIEKYDFEFIVKHILIVISNWPLIYLVCKHF